MRLGLGDTMLKLDFDNPIYETVWIGDTAVDREATDVEQWLTTGEGYVLLPQQKPSIIRYRGLTDREFLNVQTDSQDYLGNMVTEIARYGVKSIEGQSLRKEKRGGIPCLTDDSLDALAAITEELPLGRHLNHLFRVTFELLEKRLGVELLSQIPEHDESEIGEVSLVSWLAALVAARSFRSN